MFFFGIFQICDFSFCFSLLFLFLSEPSSKEDYYYISYFLIKCILIYLSSIYIAFFHNFCIWNSERFKKVKEKEKGAIVIYSNILVSGTSTLLILAQKSVPWILCCGFIELGGFNVLELGLILPDLTLITKILLITSGGLIYIFSLIQGILFYKEITK